MEFSTKIRLFWTHLMEHDSNSDTSIAGGIPIHIVDDDPAVLDALSIVFDSEGYSVIAHENGDAFLEIASESPACVLLDVHMPGRSGLEILKMLQARNYPAPIIVISGQGDIPMAVSAMQQGAVDFIEKPFDANRLLSKVKRALEQYAPDAAAAPNATAPFAGEELLTPRERDVLHQIASGASNKEAGNRLGISPRTVEVHRARIMDKLGARNAADLVRIVFSKPANEDH